MAALRELDSYLRRISLGPTCRDWEAIHRAHATSIPFENLDPAAGIPVSLDLDALEGKLVARRRGGYCFEHNLLFKAALESVGIRDIDLMLARVRQGRVTGPRPRSHLFYAWLPAVPRGMQPGGCRRSLMAARGGDGRLSERTPDTSTSRVVPHQEISAVLATEFALPAVAPLRL